VPCSRTHAWQNSPNIPRLTDSRITNGARFGHEQFQPGTQSAHLPDILLSTQKFLLAPFCEHTELWSNEAYLARPPPNDGGSATV
jgi:hypothetical protein